MLFRRLWDAVGLGRWLATRTDEMPGPYRPSLMIELWTVLLFYGGGVLDDLPLLDSTVVVRYGTKQAGAKLGYNPKKPGRPSHHPLLAFAQETGDCLGVIWRPGSANTAAGARGLHGMEEKAEADDGARRALWSEWSVAPPNDPLALGMWTLHPFEPDFPEFDNNWGIGLQQPSSDRPNLAWRADDERRRWPLIGFTKGFVRRNVRKHDSRPSRSL